MSFSWFNSKSCIYIIRYIYLAWLHDLIYVIGLVNCLIRTKEGTKEAEIGPESDDAPIFSSDIKKCF